MTNRQIEAVDVEHSPTPAERRGALKIAGLTVAGLSVFAQDVCGLGRGGLWSVVSALQAAAARVRIIDVDSTGLRSVITAVTCLALFVVFSGLNVDIRRRWPAVFVFLAMVGGSLLNDALFGEAVIEQLMTARGYQRCVPGGHALGSGRAKIWLDQFVLAGEGCRAATMVSTMAQGTAAARMRTVRSSSSRASRILRRTSTGRSRRSARKRSMVCNAPALVWPPTNASTQAGR